MSITQILHAFGDNQQVKAVVVLIVADIALGVLAGAKAGQFRLGFISNFLRNDVLGKVVPWFALFALGKTSSATVVGVDFGQIANVAFALTAAALVGSLLVSLKDLGINLPNSLAGRK